MIAAFSWDPNFQCVTQNYTAPLWQEIQEDWDRPIITYAGFNQGLCKQVVVRGFNVASMDVTLTVRWTDKQSKQCQQDFSPFSVDPNWGIKNHKSKYMG